MQTMMYIARGQAGIKNHKSTRSFALERRVRTQVHLLFSQSTILAESFPAAKKEPLNSTLSTHDALRLTKIVLPC